jgi:transcriptional regulator with XRE-family HTH domain
MGFADFLEFELERRRNRNPRYSLRAFARDLSIDHATLSQWLRGKRTITRECREELARKLELTEAEREFGFEFEKQTVELLELIPGAREHSSGAFAALLHMSVDDVNIRLQRLLRLGLLKLEGSRWSITARSESLRVLRSADPLRS